jgi:hypothetical protein
MGAGAAATLVARKNKERRVALLIYMVQEDERIDVWRRRDVDVGEENWSWEEQSSPRIEVEEGGEGDMECEKKKRKEKVDRWSTKELAEERRKKGRKELRYLSGSGKVYIPLKIRVPSSLPRQAPGSRQTDKVAWHIGWLSDVGPNSQYGRIGRWSWPDHVLYSWK